MSLNNLPERPMPYLIHFWHGIPYNKESPWMKKVNVLCRKQEADGTYFYDGSLENFATDWGDKFIYLPPQDSDRQYVMGTLCITPFGGFGQR